MSGFELYNGNQDFRITDGDRTVLTTEGMLINLLPPSNDIDLTFNVTFPDFVKDYLYAYIHIFDYGLLAGMVAYDSSASTQLTIPEQLFVDEITLMAAPASSNIFVGSIVLTHLSAPSDTWNGQTITPLQPVGEKIPFVSGSLLMETAFGMSRAFSVYVDGGNLKLHRQQSVATPPGGWNSPGTYFGDGYSYVINNPSSGGGGNYFGLYPGIPVHPHAVVNVPVTYVADGLFAPARDLRTAPGGSNACPTPNPASYNYGSVYQVSLKGAFGRRS